MDLLDATFLANTVRQWALALAAGIATLVVLRAVQSVVIGRLAALARRTRTQWDDIATQVLKHTKLVFLSLLALFAAAQVLTLSDRVRALVTSVTVIALMIQGGIWADAAVRAWIGRYREQQLGEDPATVTTVSALGFVSKLVIWSVVLLLALDNLGVDITALVAGLGVGGIAVALALQNVLGDLFASLSIVLDKPFVLGDFVIVGENLGTVEHIGLKTTRLRSLWGEQLVFSNNDILSSRLRNFGRMFERRVAFTIGVTYQTPREQLRKIPQMIREAVEAQEQTRFDRSHFSAYGDFSLNFETVYYVRSPDYNTYMDIQQAINLQIHERFEGAGIEFAYPTQTLFVVQAGG